MYVVVNDWHLNDETMGKKNIPVGFFEDFLKDVKNMAERVRAKRVVFVFNGDILDLLYTALWNYKIENGKYLYNPKGVKPWSENQGLILEKSKEILEGVLNNQKVKGFLEAFRAFSLDSPLPVEIRYIPRNHDRLIDAFPELRSRVSKAFNLEENKGIFFEKYFYDEELGLYISHGNEYDVYNFEHDSNGALVALFGDAVIIELLNRLPIEVLKETGSLNCFEKLAEIEEVRPRKTAFNFSRKVLKAGGVKLKVLSAITRQLGEEFFSNEFVEDWLNTHTIPSPRITLRRLFIVPIIKVLRLIGRNSEFDKTLVKMFNTFSLDTLEQGNSAHKRHLGSRSLKRRAKNLKYAVFGHTHDYEESVVQRNQQNYNYINLGAWLFQFYRTKRSDFEKRRHITYALFFEKGEETKSNYLIERKTIREEIFWRRKK